MTALTKSSTPTVPPARLGVLLSQRRQHLGLSIEELADKSNGSLYAEDLRLAEQGHRHLDDAFVSKITGLYECSSGSVIPARHRLIVDIDRGQIVTGTSSTTLPRTEPAEILERYLAFVYLMRDQKPGTKLDLREQDVAVLAEALGATPEQIERRLIVLMGSKQVKQRTYSIQKRITVSAVGLLVGFTSMGALILTPDTSSAATGNSEILTSSVTVQKQSTSGTGSGPHIEIPSTTILTDAGLETSRPHSGEGPTRSGGGNPERSAAVAPAGPMMEEDPDQQVVGSQSVTGQAEDLIRYDWQTHLPGWTVEYGAANPSYRGVTNRSQKTITIYVRNGESPGSIADVLAHELGHALDLEHLSDDDRIEWLNSRNLPQVWWVDDGNTDFSVGQGDFAEAVASLLVGSPSDSAHGEFTDAQLELASSLLPS